MTTANQNGDPQIHPVATALDAYQDAHPSAQIDVRRQNPVSIRVRIVDPGFSGKDRLDREPEVWNELKKLPDEVFADITMLLLLAPEEAASSLANVEFENPIPSRM